MSWVRVNGMPACRQYGKEYIALEDAAHQAHKGMWQGTFEMPADWRKDQKIDKLLAQRGKSQQPQGEFTFLLCYPQVHLCLQQNVRHLVESVCIIAARSDKSNK